jgi:hypothetical protein
MSREKHWNVNVPQKTCCRKSSRPRDIDPTDQILRTNAGPQNKIDEVDANIFYILSYLHKAHVGADFHDQIPRHKRRKMYSFRSLIMLVLQQHQTPLLVFQPRLEQIQSHKSHPK